MASIDVTISASVALAPCACDSVSAMTRAACSVAPCDKRLRRPGQFGPPRPLVLRWAERPGSGRIRAPARRAACAADPAARLDITATSTYHLGLPFHG